MQDSDYPMEELCPSCPKNEVIQYFFFEMDDLADCVLSKMMPRDGYVRRGHVHRLRHATLSSIAQFVGTSRLP